MKKINSVLIMFMLIIQNAYIVYSQQNPLANPQSIIQSGEARFTVLTSGLIRLEWNKNSRFNNAKSFVIINRQLPIVPFQKKTEKGWLIISTASLELFYKLNSGSFTPDNLIIKSKQTTGSSYQWRPGQQQKQNLKGTYRTLDGCDGNIRTLSHNKPIELEPGLLARDGWTVIDDSHTLLFDNSGWEWATRRKDTTGIDWYFIGYGSDYKQALYDYSLVAGKVPLPPRFAFGYWWSRYWSYSDNEIRSIVANFKNYQIPLSVFVIDMDWHKPFHEDQPWTGWDWNTRLFPYPDSLLKWLGTENLKTTLNLHPADGIAPYESQYWEFAKRMNFDTSTHAEIPFEVSNKKFMTTLFDVVLHPMEKKGVNFWWLDWQQWANDKKIPELSNTWWLNYTFFSDMELHSTNRPMLYHRWGGLGNHRYQIGFSGDAAVSWNTLDYQPYFTNCASNVLYTYWSHDIGGHFLPNTSTNGIDPELYTRWMQYGAFSPIFRTHSSKNSLLNKEIWNFRGDIFDALKNAVNLRYKLLPYTYTMARKTYDSAIGLCRPLYYDYPNDSLSYNYEKEYLFGDNILVAPIGKPMKDGSSNLKVWLPANSEWYEWNTGTLLKGGQEYDRNFTISEYPLYVKAGSVIPFSSSDNNNPDNSFKEITVGIFPGGNGRFTLYEDAGNNKNYDTQYATTFITSNLYKRRQVVTIFPRKGSYKGMTASRKLSVKLYGSEMPISVIVNGKKLSYSIINDGAHWNYSGSELSVSIPLGEHVGHKTQNIIVQYNEHDKVDINNGLVKKFHQLTQANIGLKSKDAGIIIPELIGSCEETNRKLEYDPLNYNHFIREFNHNYSLLPESIQQMKTSRENKNWYTLFLGL